MASPETTSKGVDALIARLRKNGVAAGQEEAGRLRADAQAEADQILTKAKAEAEKLKANAKKSADRYRKAGEEALNTAMRDAILSMKAGLMAQFEADVKRMVATETTDPGMVRKMVLELVGRTRDATGAGADAEVILPAEIVGADAIAENPEDIQSGKLTKFVVGLTQEMLKDGVTLHAAEDLQGGIRARISGNEVEIDLSDEAIAALLMQHLQPRFRAVMEGVIK